MPRPCYTLLLTFALLALGTTLAPQPMWAQDQTFTVDTRADGGGDANIGDGTCANASGNCTLRAALQEADADDARDKIEFSDIPTTPGGFAPISLNDGGLKVTEEVFIDGSTAPGYSGSPIVVLNGTNISGTTIVKDGLQLGSPLFPDALSASGSRIEGLSIINMPDEGIQVYSGTDQVQIAACYVGVNADGTTVEPNNRNPDSDAAGVEIQGNGATIATSLISGNLGNGVVLDGSNDTEILFNVIGLDANGDAAKGNGDPSTGPSGDAANSGVFVDLESSGNTISSNVISANAVNGVFIRGDENTVQGNNIGTSSDGSTTSGANGNALGNGKAGVFVAGTGAADGSNASNNVIGGPDPADGNVISGNANGITLGVASAGELATSTLIRNNIIGLNAAEDAALPNGPENQFSAGIFIGLANGPSPDNTTIRENTIAGNNGAGIFIFGDNPNTRNVRYHILDNYIGTAPDGNGSFATGLGNSGDGIIIEPNPDQNVDQTQVTDNIIGNNGDVGIRIQGSHHEIANNFIGVAPDNTDIGNNNRGVLAGNGSSRMEFVNIGGDLSNQFLPGDGQAVGNPTPTGTGNVIGYNGLTGISILGDATEAQIQQNYVGTNQNGDNLGNDSDGIFLDGNGNTTGHIVGYAYGDNGSDGSTLPLENPDPSDGGQGNVVAFNGGQGVSVDATSEVSVRGNSIFQNDGGFGDLGIDLGSDGVSSNDAGDSDSGPNNFQNFPENISVSYAPSTTTATIDYEVETNTGNAAYPLKVDFYAADTEGSGEGKIYLTTQEYSSSQANTTASVGIDLSNYPNVSSDDYFVATATDANGNTSEFTSDVNQLPVELASFEARQSGESSARLTWTTASETGNAGFRVQRRDAPENGSPGSWQKVGFVESKAAGGTTTEAKTYRFVAEDLRVGAHQFRLRQVDLDGSAHLHDPVTVEVRMQRALRLGAPAPNPVSGRATVRFAVREETEATLQLYNTLGQRVATVYRGTPPAGDGQTVDVSTTGLSSGVYFLRLRAGGQAKTQRVTVVR